MIASRALTRADAACCVHLPRELATFVCVCVCGPPLTIVLGCVVLLLQVLVKQELMEVKNNVTKRCEFIKNDM